MKKDEEKRKDKFIGFFWDFVYEKKSRYKTKEQVYRFTGFLLSLLRNKTKDEFIVYNRAVV